jgi:hypothetical protein
MTATVQPALWDLPAAPPKPVRRRNHAPLFPPRPRRTKEQRERDCDPRCLTCHHPEDRGLCSPRCAVVCVHTGQPARVELCLVMVRVQARLVIGLPGARPGRRLALVDACPYCERVHWHTPAFGLRYRTAQCGRPYLVHLPRPTTTGGAP